MATAAISLPRSSATPARIATTAAIVAVLDALFAIVLYVAIMRVTTPTRIFQSIASSLLGRASFEGGAQTVGLGMLIHVSVATGWTLLFAAALRVVESLERAVSSTRGALTIGATYGAVIWLMMDLVLIPLTQSRPTPVSAWTFWATLAWHMTGVGRPIVFGLRTTGMSS